MAYYLLLSQIQKTTTTKQASKTTAAKMPQSIVSRPSEVDVSVRVVSVLDVVSEWLVLRRGGKTTTKNTIITQAAKISGPIPLSVKATTNGAQDNHTTPNEAPEATTP